jgi:hypothetical protein
MINLEQVKLLETKVARAIEYVERVHGENAALLQKEVELRARLESYQKRIDELEVLILRFKEDQGRIEDGILSALDRLNQFEESIEKSLRNTGAAPVKGTAGTRAAAPPASVRTDAAAMPGGNIFFEIPHEPAGAADGTAGPPAEPVVEDPPVEIPDRPADSGELDIF